MIERFVGLVRRYLAVVAAGSYARDFLLECAVLHADILWASSYRMSICRPRTR